MVSRVLAWLRAESGAVTVDWTVLAAAVVGLGVATVGAVRSGVVSLGSDVEASLTSASVVSLGSLGSGSWQYTPLYSGLTMDWMNGPGGFIAQITAWNQTPAQLQTHYDGYAASAQTYIDQGNSNWAGLYVDHMYAVEQVLAAQGATLSPTSASVQALHQAVLDM